MLLALRKAARRALRAAILVLRAAERSLGTPEILAAEQKASVGQAMELHDMVESPDEAYYRDRYLELIERELTDAELAGRLLDAACGSGRLLVPLAQRASRHGGTVVGVDYLASAAEAAERHLRAAGLDNAEVVDADLLAWLKQQEPASFDAVVFLEAGYIMPQLDEVLAELARVSKPGAALFASLRPRQYVARLGVQLGRWDVARAALDWEHGTLDGIGWQAWHDQATLTTALGSAGFYDVRLSAIGAASGIEGDPLAAIARPSSLAPPELAELAAIEQRLGQLYPESGRYLLACARRV